MHTAINNRRRPWSNTHFSLPLLLSLTLAIRPSVRAVTMTSLCSMYYETRHQRNRGLICLRGGGFWPGEFCPGPGGRGLPSPTRTKLSSSTVNKTLSACDKVARVNPTSHHMIDARCTHTSVCCTKPAPRRLWNLSIKVHILSVWPARAIGRSRLLSTGRDISESGNWTTMSDCLLFTLY